MFLKEVSVTYIWYSMELICEETIIIQLPSPQKLLTYLPWDTQEALFQNRLTRYSSLYFIFLSKLIKAYELNKEQKMKKFLKNFKKTSSRRVESLFITRTTAGRLGRYHLSLFIVSRRVVAD